MNKKGDHTDEVWYVDGEKKSTPCNGEL